MALKIRLSRGGRKKRPFYSVVVADSRQPRDGRFIEKLGTYNPLLAKDDESRVTLNGERITYWLSQGAQPSDRVAVFLGKAGLADMPAQKNNPEKAKPKAAALQRIEDKKAKEEAKKEADAAAAAEAEAAAAAPAEETAEETPAETPAEEATTEEAATETAETPAEEATEEKKEDSAA